MFTYVLTFVLFYILQICWILIKNFDIYIFFKCYYFSSKFTIYNLKMKNNNLTVELRNSHIKLIVYEYLAYVPYTTLVV